MAEIRLHIRHPAVVTPMVVVQGNKQRGKLMLMSAFLALCFCSCFFMHVVSSTVQLHTSCWDDQKSDETVVCCQRLKIMSCEDFNSLFSGEMEQSTQYNML